MTSANQPTPTGGSSTPSKDSHKRRRPTLKETQASQQIPPEVWRAIQYLEYRKLRHDA